MTTIELTWKDRMKQLIKSRVLFKSDEYYSDLILDDFRIEETSSLDMAFHAKEMKIKNIEIVEGKQYYDLKFLINSDSYKLWKLYQNKGDNIAPEDIHSLDLPDSVKENFITSLNDLGVEGAMDRYNLRNRAKYRTVARYYDTNVLEEIIEILKAFEQYRGSAVGLGFRFEEMLDADEVKAFYFVRKSRVKIENSDPACFDGNCLERNILNGKIAIFGREVD